MRPSPNSNSSATPLKNEEFAALGVEIERYQEEVRKLEDREILLMEKGETLGARLAKAQAKLDSTAALVNEELAQIAEKKSNCESRIAELDAERAKLVDGVDDSTLGVYDRLMKSKGDAAVVLLEHGVCGGCHMKVITTTLHKVKAEKEIAQCEQCGRMLYLEE
ncbi:MAG: C4-type zinc ribbon domain-containing protein [Verrucomicrobiales bacterium]